MFILNLNSEDFIIEIRIAGSIGSCSSLRRT